MKKTKRTKLGIILGCFLLITTFVVAYGGALFGVMSLTAASGKDYFATENSTISVANESDAVKITVTPSARTAKLNYRSYIDSGDLSNFITMQILPSIANSVDFLSMDVILQDSVDPTQQLLTTLAVQNVNGNKKTVATVALTDAVEYIPANEKWLYSENVGGYQYLLSTSQVTYGYDNGGWATGAAQYTHMGTTIHGDSVWQSGYYFDQGANGGPGSNNHYGYLKKNANKDCIPFTMSFVNKEMKIDGYNAPPTYVNGYKIAKIDDNDFLTKSVSSLPSNSPYKERYTSQHVANMFSSGKVKLSFRFNGIQESNSIFNKIEFRLKALKGQDFTKGNGFTGDINISGSTTGGSETTGDGETTENVKPSILFFNAENSTVGVTNEKDSVKLTITPSAKTARINYLNYIDSIDLSNFITMQVLPSVANSVDFLDMDIILEDSVDPTQQLLTSVAVQTVNGNKKTVATVALTDSVEYIPADGKWVYSENVGGFQYLLNSSQVTYGFDNGGWATGTPQYAHFGTTLHGDQNWEGGYYFDQGLRGGPGSNNHYGYLKKNESKDCIPFTLSFIGNEMKIDGYNAPPTYVNGYKIAKIDDPEFIKNSTFTLSNDSPYKTRYKIEHITNLFSSGKVKLSLRFNGIQEKDNKFNEINVRLKALKGQDFSSGKGIVDKMPPILTALKSNFVTYKSFENMLSTLVSAFDADSKLTYAVKVNNTPVENISNYVFSQTGNYELAFTATDSAGNISNTVTEQAKVLDFDLPKSLKVEIDSEVSHFSTLNLSEGFGYTADLLSGDSQLPNILAEDINSYSFTGAGNYKLRYNIFSATVRNYGFMIPISVEDTTAPEINFDTQYLSEYELGTVLNILEPTIKDNFDKDLTYSVEAQVNGKNAEILDNKLPLQVLADYNLIYTSVDSKNNKQIKNFLIHVTEDKTKPEIKMTKTLKEKYAIGDILDIDCATASDLVDKNVKVETSLELDGKKLALKGNNFRIEKAGAYVLTIKASDAAGNVSTKTIKFSVDKKPFGFIWLFLIIPLAILLAVGIFIAINFKKFKKEKNNEKITEQNEIL